jgi:hypothetical protein
MRVLSAAQARSLPTDRALTAALANIREAALRETVSALAYPRHAVVDAANNRRAAAWIAERLRGWGYDVRRQGEHGNIVALPSDCPPGPLRLVGVHYDTVPGTPGADDNGSAVAALLECARIAAEFAPQGPLCFVAFNREEDGLLGSADFVRQEVTAGNLRVREAHVLEMVGFCDHRPHSQRLPAEVPVRVRDSGDFLGLVANGRSHRALGGVLRAARSYVPELPVLGLQVYSGMEKRLPPLLRSDHAPFWAAGVPALMWTDTSEFRNPHYHQPSDLPETLDYAFLAAVTRLLVAQLLTGIDSDR